MVHSVGGFQAVGSWSTTQLSATDYRAGNRAGYLIAAFSGGPSELDLKVSQSGLAVLAERW